MNFANNELILFLAMFISRFEVAFDRVVKGDPMLVVSVLILNVQTTRRHSTSRGALYCKSN